MADQIHLPDLTPLVVIGIIVGVLLFVIALPLFASIAAPTGRRFLFFFMTLLLGPLGPFGVCLAACAVPPEPEPMAGMRQLYCWRCEAMQNVDKKADSYDCWRCQTHQKA
jgi:hypothetical protein